MTSLRKGLVAVGIVGALALAACGSSGSSSRGGGGGTSGGASPQQVVMVVPTMPDNLTIFPYGGNASQTVLSGLGSQLGVYEHSCSSAVPGQVVGKLAQSITVAPDHKSITVKLRPLKSQYGNTLSAKDIEWSFVKYGFVIQPVLKKTFEASGYDTSNMITIVDEHTVRFNLKTFNSYSVDMLQNPLAYVYDSTEAQKHETSGDPLAQKWLFTHLADYSGWKLENFTPGQSMTVAADPNWGGPKPKVDRIVVQGVPDDATRQQLLTSGKAQVGLGFQYGQFKSLESSSGIKVQSCPSLNMDNLMFSTKNKPLEDVRVRQAISMAIDRSQIVAGAYAGYATPAKSSFNAAFGYGTYGDAYTYNPGKAKSLLAQAGYPHGVSITLTYSPTRPGPVVERSAVLVQSMLAKIGVKVTLREVASPTEMSDTMYISHNYQSAMYGEPVAIADPAYLAWIKFGNSPNNSGTFWHTDQMTKLLAEVAATPTEEKDKRLALFKQIAQIGDTQVPLTELVETPYLVAMHGVTSGVPLPNGQLSFNGIG